MTESEPTQAAPRAVAGILDVRDRDAFIRVRGYAPSDDDVRLGIDQVRRHHLRPGDHVSGQVADGKRYATLTSVRELNGAPPRWSADRPAFADLVPLFPHKRLRLETAADEPIGRVVDLVAPIGKGQRGLIVARPNTGKTTIMKTLAHAVAANHPECHLMMVLIDERPEEVTEMRRAVRGAEIVASTFDHAPKRHTAVAELAIERAKRLVEAGRDVVVVLDSLTRLARAYNLAAPGGGRVLTGGLDAAALYPPKKFLGAARAIENGGSLTILASALIDTGSRLDEIIFEEFKGTGNMELRLDRVLADRRIYPAVDVQTSGTRREELLFTPQELQATTLLRRALSALDTQAAMEQLLSRLKETPSNAAFIGGSRAQSAA